MPKADRVNIGKVIYNKASTQFSFDPSKAKKIRPVAGFIRQQWDVNGAFYNLLQNGNMIQFLPDQMALALKAAREVRKAANAEKRYEKKVYARNARAASIIESGGITRKKKYAAAATNLMRIFGGSGATNIAPLDIFANPDIAEVSLAAVQNRKRRTRGGGAVGSLVSGGSLFQKRRRLRLGGGR